MPTKEQISRWNRRCYLRQKEKFAALGLNTDGKPYRRQPNFKTEAQRHRNRLRLNLKYYYQRAEKYEALGLNRIGKPRKHRAALPKHLQYPARLERNKKRYRARTEHLLALGLTCRGTPFRRKHWRVQSPNERAWRQLRAEMNVPNNDWLTPLER